MINVNHPLATLGNLFQLPLKFNNAVDFSSMAEHAPIITTLRPGFINVASPKGDFKYFVTGGFAEVSAGSTSVLAEKAYLDSDLTKEIASELLSEANLKYEKSASDITAKYCSDLEVALSDI